MLITVLFGLVGHVNFAVAQDEPTQKNGVYQISSFSNLIWFATQVNGGSTTLNAALTADISQGTSTYTPIGTESNPYHGSFDGKGHSITLALGSNTAYSRQGIFGAVTGGVHIQNLIAKGEVKGQQFIGGIAGAAQGTGQVLIENCGNEATLTAVYDSNANAGGILGCNIGSGCAIIMNRCYNFGTVNGSDSGGLCGWAGNRSSGSIFSYCYNAGSVNCNGTGNGDFARNDNYSLTLNHCYYLTGCNSAYQRVNNQLEEMSTAQAICDHLNSNDGTYWGMLGGDHPVFGCDELTDVTEVYLSNTDFSRQLPIKSYIYCTSSGDRLYGLQIVTNWSKQSNPSNTNMAAGIFEYGLTEGKLVGSGSDGIAPPTKNPEDKASGNCLGFMAQSGEGGYYYQAVTLPKGSYTFRTTVYKTGGSTAPDVNYISWYPTSGSGTDAVNQSVFDMGEGWYTLQVCFTLTATTSGQLRIGYKSGGGTGAAAPHLFFDNVKLLGNGTQIGWEQVTDVDQLAKDDFVYMLEDGKEGKYTMANTSAFNGYRPVYMTEANPFTVPSQVWTMEKSGTNYSLRSYVDGYYFNSGTEGWNDFIGKDNTNGNFTIAEVGTTNVFTLRSATVTGDNYVGPWNQGTGYVVLTTAVPAEDAGHEGVAANKNDDRGPGFYIYRMKRAQYAARRIYSQTLMANGWSQVTTTDGLGRTGYEYLLLDMSEQGVESGYVLSGNVNGVGAGDTYRGKYTVLSSGSEPTDIQKWRMGATGTGFYLKNVSNDLFFYAPTYSFDTGFTADASAAHIDFAFNVSNGIWTLVNSINTTHFVGRWAGNDSNEAPCHPYDGEDVAFNKNAQKGKRQFMILSRPTGNLGIVNGGDEGWTEIHELPADVNNYFYSFYSNEEDGLGLKLANGTAGMQGADHKTMQYASSMNPNKDKNALWTLAKDSGGHIQNTSPMFPEYMMQTEWGASYFYRTNNNGSATAINNESIYDWGYILPTYTDASHGWTIENGKYTGNYLGNWEEGHPETRNPKVGDDVAFNKNAAGRDIYEIFSIPRGRYMANDVAGKSSEQDISYIITNADATRRTTIGWTQTMAGGFQVQNNTAFGSKDGEFYFEAYDGQTLSDRQIYQEYTEVPDGYYTIKVKTNVSAGGAFLFLNGEQVPLMQKDATTGVVTLTARISSGTLRFGIKLKKCETNWVAFDQVRLYYNTQKDESDTYLWNPSFELSNASDGHMMGWTTPNASNLAGQTEARNNDHLTGKHGDWYFNTYDTGNKTLDLKTTTKVKLPAGVYQLTAQLCTTNGHSVVMEAFASDTDAGSTAAANLLNSVTYNANHEGALDDGSQISELNSLFFTLAQEKYVTIYVYTQHSSEPFFKADDFRIITYADKPNIANGVLPNPSFEYANGSGTMAVPGIVYSTAKGVNNLSDGQEGNGGVYGWDTSKWTDNGLSGGENRVAIGADFSLDQYYFQPADKISSIPTAADGTRYLYTGQYRQTSGNETASMSTTTLGTLPKGTYIATIKIRATVSYQGTTYADWTDYNGKSVYDGDWPLREADDPASFTFAASTESGTSLASIAVLDGTSNGQMYLINRSAGNLNNFKSSENFPFGGRDQRSDYLTGAWTKMWLVFRLETPTKVKFEITDKFRRAYGIDILIDDLRLQVMNEIPEPQNHATNVASGTEYYLQNAATGYFLGAGATFGTHASLIDHGQPFKIEGSSIYTLDSYTYNGADKHYLNGDYVDGASANYTITHTGDGKFTLKNGDGNYVKPVSSVATSSVITSTPDATNDLLAKWYLITKPQREQTMLDNALEPDATFYIPNASFGRGQNTEWNKNCWKSNRFQGNFTLGDTHVAESYHSPFYVKKTVTVPNGTYKFRAQGFYREDVVTDKTRNDYLPVFFANDEEVTFPKRTGIENSRSAAELSFLDGKYYSDYVTVIVTDNLLTVGARLDVNESLWCCWDNFELALVSKNNPATTADLTDVNSAFSAMEAALGFEGEHWAPYTVTEAKDMLVAQGTAGSYTFDAIDTNFPYSYDKVDEYLLGLANTEYVNAFYRGDFAEYHNWDVTSNATYRAPALGWQVDGATADGVLGLKYTDPVYDNTDTGNTGLRAVDSRKALYIADGTTATYGAATGYKMPLKVKNYKLTFQYAGWGGTPTITLSGTSITTSVALPTPLDAISDGTNWKTYTLDVPVNPAGENTISFDVSGGDAAIANLQLLPSTMEVDPDLYYLYNKGGQNYLDAGGEGDRTAISSTIGLDFGVRRSGVGYSFDSQIMTTQDNHFLSNTLEDSKLYCDVGEAAWYLMSAGDGFVYIYNAADKFLTYNEGNVTLAASASSDNQKWKLKTYKDRVDELTAMTAGDAAVDATFLIRCNSFRRNDSRMSNWTTWAFGYDNTLHEFPEGSGHNEVQFRRGGLNSNYVVESYNRAFDVSQTVTTRNKNGGTTLAGDDTDAVLPHGIYTMTAQQFWNNPNGLNGANVPYIYIKDNDHESLVHVKKQFERYETGDLAFEVGTISSNFATPSNHRSGEMKAYVFGDGSKVSFTVGAKCDGGGSWAVFDNFRLTYRPFAYSDATYENGNRPLVNIGDGPFQIPTSDTYYAAMKGAKDKVENSAASGYINASADEDAIRPVVYGIMNTWKQYVDNAKVNAWTTPSATKFSIANKQYADVVLSVLGLKGATGNAISLGFTEAAGSVFPQAFTFEKVDGVVNGFKLHYKDGNSDEAYLHTGESINTEAGNRMLQIRSKTDASGALTFRVTPQTTADGDWYLKNTAVAADEATSGYDDWYMQQAVAAHGCRIGLNDTGFYTGTGTAGTDAYKFSFPEAQKPSVSMSVSSAYKFSTLMLPFECPYPTGVAAYKVTGIKSTEKGNAVILTEETEGKFLANTPYILYAESGLDNTTLSQYGQAFKDATITDGALTGTCTVDYKNPLSWQAQVCIPQGAYVLAAKEYCGEKKVGLYYTTNSTTKLPINRIYFQPSLISGGDTKAEVYFFQLDDDDVDEVEEVELGQLEVEGIYDARGMRLPKMQKGMNIVRYTNGKTQKIIVK